LIGPPELRARPDIGDRIGAGLPALLAAAVFERPGDDADAADMLVVDRHRPGQFGRLLLALRRGAGLADIGDQERVRHDAFGVTDKAVAVRQVLYQLVAHPERRLLPAD